MNPRARVVVIVLAIVGLAGSFVLLNNRGPQNAAGPPLTPVAPYALRSPGECTLPEKIARPRWVPKTLELPEGSYAIEDLPEVAEVRKALFLAPGSLDAFVEHVESVWPKNGWQMGPGEREPWEAEGTFEKGSLIGSFRAQVTCDKNRTVLLLILAES